MYMVHSHILQHKDYYKVHSFICVLFYNKNKWVRAENNGETKKCTKSCDEISIAIPQIVDGKKNQVNFTDSGIIFKHFKYYLEKIQKEYKILL